MESDKWLQKLKEKQKFFTTHIGVGKLFLLVLAGVFLVLASKTEGKEKKIAEQTEIVENQDVEDLEEYIRKQEKKLADILTKVDGIGEVEVMITAKASKEKITLKDTPYQRTETNEQDSGGGTRQKTEISSEETSVMDKLKDGEETPYVTKELQPEIEGVIVIATGAKNPQIETEINEAVVALFSVPAHKIKVMKMK
ncbi:MAG: stage III sporulation protein AG [Lachnospiraceae bacterium]|nr:stage III sporulation protein AG [Lachnospiraceae bacterium]